MSTNTANKPHSIKQPASDSIWIGADELILWMRKNGRAATVRNDVLGTRIAELIRPLIAAGRDNERENIPSRWDADDSQANDFNLPKTACQYKVPVNRVNEIYAAIVTW